ncbi:sialidase family protein [Sphingomonas sp. Mn802worker]|uniref:sialidase family protein n=1 Tax=Sphingomonas sp. Mn802worker TaxID=629773 RepID=UPI0012EA7356|nr:sialidase family protein [Sphingomonas sp. Mn802worker]
MKRQHLHRAALRRITRTIAGATLLTASLLAAQAASAQSQLNTTSALYARVRTMPNGELVSTVTSFDGGAHIDVYASSNAGGSFAKVGQINDAEFSSGLCCGNIYVLPRAIGSMAAGTMIWAGSVGQSATNRRMKIKLYHSTDNGRTWRYITNPVVSPNTGGLWEPEFIVANDGALVMFYSDETDGVHSQRLLMKRSYNGTSWVDQTDVVVSTINADRPGMAVIGRLASGTRYMTYEMCGPAACTTFYRTSTDGWNWGSASNVGTALRLSDGRYFAHAPYNAVMANGAILVVGQVLRNADNTTAAGSGSTLFKSASGDPAGPWVAVSAPVSVPNPDGTNPCPNYSAPLLSVAGGQVLEIAGRLQGSTCIQYYARSGF